MVSEIAERFWVKVDKTGECWLWTAGRSSTGYGLFSVGGRAGGMVLAHRWAFEAVRGGMLPALAIDHLCRVRLCVNPAHLEQVTVGENNRRAAPHRDADAFRSSMERRRRADFESRCVRGHSRSTDDYVDKRGTIHCRECKRARDRKAVAT